MGRSTVFQTTIRPEVAEQIRALVAEGHNVGEIVIRMNSNIMTIRRVLKELGLLDEVKCKRNHFYHDTYMLRTLAILFKNWHATDSALSREIGITREFVGQVRGWMVANQVVPPADPMKISV